jgi:hypothetical protein
MNYRLLAFICSFAAGLTSPAFGQPVLSAETLQAEFRQCQIIQRTLDSRAKLRSPREIPSDDFTVAGSICEKLGSDLKAGNEPAAQNDGRDLYAVLARMNLPPANAVERLAALEAATAPKTPDLQFFDLRTLAKTAFEAGDLEKAQSYATRLLDMAHQGPENWNTGNAIHDGYMVLGRVALRRGNVALAEEELLNAGSTKGSPQLNSFGPNVSLANDLLQAGRTAVVLQYFTLCKNFWKSHPPNKADEWIETIRGGGIPDFGANLMY